ncbi:NAD(P)-binding oxidoreductase [uncultured Gimesia sp.]|uniref:NAD(P)-dependent oxidoreductase n=1 Tax=uncultured Gimesia sp. TaxID=1678688 RepID=UPI0030DA4382|tara:strand:+ start:8373 stop:9098 length:726 start_codon:yes stop_codon:yes gene_type:complete
MTTLVVGATGATGRLLVEQLLQRGEQVKAIVRTPDSFNDFITGHEGFSEIQASVHDLTDAEIQQHVTGCDAFASCLGHQLSLKGIFGKPRLLVTDTVRHLCEAIQATHAGKPVRFVLMNTAGNSNRDLKEPISLAQKCVIGLLRLLVPPHPDNEKAADYLRTKIGHNSETIEWAVVRPDSLLNEDDVSEYELHPSPTRSAIFNAGQTSRINVGHFMAELVTNEETWNQWKGQMPVIYNKVE